MKIVPYDHQLKIWKEDLLWIGIFQGTGSAKTLSSLGLAEGRTLVVVEKQLREERKFQKELLLLEREIDLTVMSKEDFRKAFSGKPSDAWERFDTVIVDEAHNFFGVTTDTFQQQGNLYPKTSIMYQSLRNYLAWAKPKRFYPLTATPASKPMHVYAIATLFGKEWNYFNFREAFYVQVKKGYRTFWIPRGSEAIKQRLADNVKRFGYTGTLNDFFDVPEQVYRNVYVDLTAEQKREMKRLDSEVADPMAKRSLVRSLENGVLYGYALESGVGGDRLARDTRYFPSEKTEKILQLAEEFPKMLVFADYIGQIDMLALALQSEGYRVFKLTGATKDRKTILEEAERLEKCIVIASSKISAGYEWKSCPVVVFASKSNRYLNYDQALGRVQRADAIKVNLYVSLIVRGGMDEACHDTVMLGNDFQEMVMREDNDGKI